MFTVLVVIGTRPEAIKMAMLIKALKKKKQLRCRVCITAQHRSMLDQVLDFFGIVADHDLNIMQPNQPLATTSAMIMSGLQPILEDLHPDLVLVHGDTNTTLAAALTAFYMKIPVAHVEAGMRTHNLSAPFPEEANRVLTSRITSLHFAPTKENVHHLKNEGVPANKIVRTGNTVIDSLLYTARKVNKFTYLSDARLQNAMDKKQKILLVTAHRRENFGVGFEQICSALSTLAQRNPELIIVFPVHLNPHVQEPMYRELNGISNILLIAPLQYPDFVFLMKKAHILLTDSGGIQEEGPSLGKPVLVMREVTERPEAVRAGTVQLTGTSEKRIIRTVETLLYDTDAYNKMAKRKNPYGDGLATKRIVDYIVAHQKEIRTLKP